MFKFFNTYMVAYINSNLRILRILMKISMYIYHLIDRVYPSQNYVIIKFKPLNKFSPFFVNH